MEHGIVNLKFVLTGVSMAAMMCMAAAMAVPALAQGGGASSVTGDASVDNSVDAQYTSVNTNICSNFAQGQYVGGDLIIGEGGVNNVINQCIAAGFLPEDGGDGDGTDPPDDGTDPPADDDTDPPATDDDTDQPAGDDATDDAGDGAVTDDGVMTATIPDKVLANTGGVSLLTVAGGGLILAGAGALFFLAGIRRSLG